MMTGALKDLRILVTRPADQASKLAVAIRSAGGEPVLLPALEIRAAQDSETAGRCRQVADYDWVIFISRNAVEYALPLLPTATWPTRVKIAAVGSATAADLEAADLPVDLLPVSGTNSEALLEAFKTHELDGKRVLIVRGVGGREKLATGLRERGARVDYAEVYRRSCPATPASELDAVFGSALDIMIASSGETLSNLLELRQRSSLPVDEGFFATPLVVVSERVRQLAVAAGFNQTVIVAKTPGDTGIVEAIANWHASTHASPGE